MTCRRAGAWLAGHVDGAAPGICGELLVVHPLFTYARDTDAPYANGERICAPRHNDTVAESGVRDCARRSLWPFDRAVDHRRPEPCIGEPHPRPDVVPLALR